MSLCEYSIGWFNNALSTNLCTMLVLEKAIGAMAAGSG